MLPSRVLLLLLIVFCYFQQLSCRRGGGGGHHGGGGHRGGGHFGGGSRGHHGGSSHHGGSFSWSGGRPHHSSRPSLSIPSSSHSITGGSIHHSHPKPAGSNIGFSHNRLPGSHIGSNVHARPPSVHNNGHFPNVNNNHRPTNQLLPAVNRPFPSQYIPHHKPPSLPPRPSQHIPHHEPSIPPYRPPKPEPRPVTNIIKDKEVNIYKDKHHDKGSPFRFGLSSADALGALMGMRMTMPYRHSSNTIILSDSYNNARPPAKSPAHAFRNLQPKCGIRDNFVPQSLYNNNVKRHVVKREATKGTSLSNSTIPASDQIYVYAYEYELEMPPQLAINGRNEPKGEAEPRIVGGVAISSNDAESYPPWQVSLRFQDTHVCGGSLISSQFVITAAHCFKETSSDPSVWSVYLGKVRRSLGEPTEIGPLRVISVAVHPEYGDKMNKRFDADIALLYLAEPVRYNSHAFPICLPQEGQDAAPGHMCVITGFGDTKETGDEGHLKEAFVPIIDSNLCRSSSKRMEKALTGNMFCAGYMEEGGTDACQGDSGGPLACPNAKGDVYVLNGIISWGYDCGAANAPGVYTRVANFVPWIRQTTAALTAAHQAGGGTTPNIVDPMLQ